MLYRVIFGLCLIVDLFAQDTGRVTGTLTDPVGDSVANAEVLLLGASGIQKQVSDQQGRFSFSGLADGVYEIQVEARDFKQNAVDIKIQAGRRTSAKIFLDLYHGCSLLPYTTIWKPIPSTAAAVHGYVDPPDGAASVTLRDSAGRVIARTIINDRGQFEFQDIPPGPYTLSARSDGSAEFTMKNLQTQRGYRTEIARYIALPKCEPGKPCKAIRRFPLIICA